MPPLNIYACFQQDVILLCCIILLNKHKFHFLLNIQTSSVNAIYVGFIFIFFLSWNNWDCQNFRVYRPVITFFLPFASIRVSVFKMKTHIDGIFSLTPIPNGQNERLCGLSMVCHCYREGSNQQSATLSNQQLLETQEPPRVTQAQQPYASVNSATGPPKDILYHIPLKNPSSWRFLQHYISMFFRNIFQKYKH